MFAAPGDLDLPFNSTGAFPPINCLALLPSDNRILAGCDGTSPLLLYRTDGAFVSAFPTFATSTGGTPSVRAVRALADGKILVGGDFTSIGGVSANRLARLQSNGTVDTTFNPGGAGIPAYQYVSAIELDPAGRIYIGGTFSAYNGAQRPGIARLLPDGTLDASFAPPVIYQGPSEFFTGTAIVEAIVPLPQGGVLIGGLINRVSTVPGRSFGGLIQLDEFGRWDARFLPAPGSRPWIKKLCVLRDGRVLAGTYESPFNSVVTKPLCLLPSGAVDPVFLANIGSGPNSHSSGGVLEDSDGKLLIAGWFTSWNGTPAASVVRLLSNGTLDTSFVTTPGNSDVFQQNLWYATSLVQPDGRWLLGRAVSSSAQVNGTIVRNAVRHLAGADGSTGQVNLRSTALEIGEGQPALQVTVERVAGVSGAASVLVSTSPGTAAAGADYTTVSTTVNWPAGVGGPRVVNIPLLQDTAEEGGETFSVALSSVSGAAMGARTSAVVTITDDDGAPVVRSQPVSRVVAAGASVVLTVDVDSFEKPTYQWRRNEVEIPGAEEPHYFIQSFVPGSAAGNYDCLVSNSKGAVLTEVAMLSEPPPPETFASYMTRIGLAGGAQDQDTDGDGISNALEFALGGNAAIPGDAAAQQPVAGKKSAAELGLGSSGDYLTLTVRLRTDITTSAVGVEYATTPGELATTPSPATLVGAPLVDGSFETRTYRAGAAGNGFLRLVVVP